MIGALLPLAEVGPTATNALYAVATAAAIGLVSEILKRGTVARDRTAAAKAKKEAEDREGGAVVEVKRLDSLKDLQIHYDEQIHRLRKEFNVLRIQDLQRIARLEDDIGVLRGCYFGLFSVAQMLLFHFRAMRRRLKKADPNFDDAEFPDVDLTPWGPDKIFPKLAHTTNLTVNVEPGVSTPVSPTAA